MLNSQKSNSCSASGSAELKLASAVEMTRYESRSSERVRSPFRYESRRAVGATLYVSLLLLVVMATIATYHRGPGPRGPPLVPSPARGPQPVCAAGRSKIGSR